MKIDTGEDLNSCIRTAYAFDIDSNLQQRCAVSAALARLFGSTFKQHAHLSTFITYIYPAACAVATSNKLLYKR